MSVVEPAPAASVVLIRPALPASGRPGRLSAPEALELYLIRRSSRMRFLGGYYAFPGGKVEAVDVAPESLARCVGLSAQEARRVLSSGSDALPGLAFWVAAIRELFEETGVFLACDAVGRPVDPRERGVAARVEGCRKALMAGEGTTAEALAAEGWFFDARPLRYLSHFITPASSPIRFSARFFLAALPAGQEPRLFLEETSEGFWMGPGEAYRRFQAGQMAMAEPAEYTLRYLAQFESARALWAHHADGRHKFHGILHRVEFYGAGYDWRTATWRLNKPAWHP